MTDLEIFEEELPVAVEEPVSEPVEEPEKTAEQVEAERLAREARRQKRENNPDANPLPPVVPSEPTEPPVTDNDITSIRTATPEDPTGSEEIIIVNLFAEEVKEEVDGSDSDISVVKSDDSRA